MNFAVKQLVSMLKEIQRRMRYFEIVQRHSEANLKLKYAEIINFSSKMYFLRTSDLSIKKLGFVWMQQTLNRAMIWFLLLVMSQIQLNNGFLKSI